MTTPQQRQNLLELIVALQGTATKDDPTLSKDLLMLLKEGVHSNNLPDALQPAAAESFQLTFEAVGGVARQVLWADRNYGAFMKLYARQTNPTIAPVVPPAQVIEANKDWPEWLTQRRLAYQEAPSSDPTTEDTDGD